MRPITIKAHTMAKKKKSIKAKEPVRIRFKELSNGNKSIYLDIYKDGKRSYEFLKMYLIPEGSEEARTRNDNTLRAVNAIKAQRIIQITNDEAGITNTQTRSKMLLLDWVDEYKNRKIKSGHSDNYCRHFNTLVLHLKAYRGESITLKDVDKAYCMGFIDYLTTTKKEDGKAMSKATGATYFRLLRCILNLAVDEDLILTNPIDKIKPEDRIKTPESKREYLTEGEVQSLIDTQCVNESIKNAFLFSCFCGLRISDIRALKWGDIETNREIARAKIVMQKTKRVIYLPLSKVALEWMPGRGKSKETDEVFKLPNDGYINTVLKSWAYSAGITKNVSFHVARHTFATLMITMGNDLYTVSKLLGHTNVKTTEIYAKIIDQKKVEAVNTLDGIFRTPKQ